MLNCFLIVVLFGGIDKRNLCREKWDQKSCETVDVVKYPDKHEKNKKQTQFCLFFVLTEVDTLKENEAITIISHELVTK